MAGAERRAEVEKAFPKKFVAIFDVYLPHIEETSEEPSNLKWRTLA